ncbi:hypothetical protein lbkm_1197 [Lachnospiraceae bacterium KM106-2]|nr:hypothetical protein lbkm_1197 [Lachnospiraceae bacterium KM106-2]
MKKITVLYSPLCEANGAFLGKLEEWLKDQEVEIEAIPYHKASIEYKKAIGNNGNCFIHVFCDGKQIDTVPLHKDRIYSALGITQMEEKVMQYCETSVYPIISTESFKKAMKDGKITFLPITKDSYQEEMTMCLCNYPMGNPPRKYHNRCRSIKEEVYQKVWERETIAGMFAKWNDKVIGLLEVFPREIIKQYGYLTGTTHKEEEYLTVGCYEIGYGIPRVIMIDALMDHLLQNANLFCRKKIEGIGIYEWPDGFNPYWVYEKYGFHKVEQITDHTIVMEKILS